jgi:type IV fimbrial biogenesis protein FimT
MNTFKTTRQSGFTLGELMTSLAIAGILTAIAVPGMQSIIDNNRRVSITNQMTYTMHTARSEAITRNVQVTICPSSNQESCNDGAVWEQGWIAFTDIGRDRDVNGDDEIVVVSQGVANIDVYVDEFDDFLVYRPNGRILVADAAVNTGQFTFCDPRGAEYARVVYVNTSGRPKLSEHQLDQSAPECGG